MLTSDAIAAIANHATMAKTCISRIIMVLRYTPTMTDSIPGGVKGSDLFSRRLAIFLGTPTRSDGQIQAKSFAQPSE